MSNLDEQVPEPLLITPPDLASPSFGPLLPHPSFQDIKDPCPVFDGVRWHIFGSGGTIITETWSIFHAIAPHFSGPWEELPPAVLHGVSGDHVAAPGVLYDLTDHQFHLFVQTDFMALGGTVQHLVSSDGNIFTLSDTALSSIPDSDESCIYDPHPAIVHGKKYLTYSGARTVGCPDIYIAESASNTWEGPWVRKGKILSQADVPHHNQPLDHDYEWGLEGPQLIEIDQNTVLLNATCFLPGLPRGTRQRVFFALGSSPLGPFRTLGPVITPSIEGWDSGENGHAAGFVWDTDIVLFYQARPRHPDIAADRAYNPTDVHWNYGIKQFSINTLLSDAAALAAGHELFEPSNT